MKDNKALMPVLIIIIVIALIAVVWMAMRTFGGPAGDPNNPVPDPGAIPGGGDATPGGGETAPVPDPGAAPG